MYCVAQYPVAVDFHCNCLHLCYVHVYVGAFNCCYYYRLGNVSLQKIRGFHAFPYRFQEEIYTQVLSTAVIIIGQEMYIQVMYCVAQYPVAVDFHCNPTTDARKTAWGQGYSELGGNVQCKRLQVTGIMVWCEVVRAMHKRAGTTANCLVS